MFAFTTHSLGSKVCTSVHFSENSLLLASAHPDGKVRLWDPRQRDEAACVNTFGKGGKSGESPAQFVSHVSLSNAMQKDYKFILWTECMRERGRGR